MRKRILSAQFFVILMGIVAIAMIIPGVHAAAVKNYFVMRAFIQSSIVLMVLTILIGIATDNYTMRNQARGYLLTLFMTFTALPLMLAVPFYEAVQNTSFLNSYVEMVSSLTTTGATLFESDRLSPSVHLWRGLVGWMGGFFVWVTAAAVLAPMNLGGFEVLSPSATGRGASQLSGVTWASNYSKRLQRFSVRLLPIYLGLTVVLWLGLLLAGDMPLVAFMHAMATLATSGISPIGGLEQDGSGRVGEVLILLFLVFAISRQTFSTDQPGANLRRIALDPEFRIGVTLVVLIPVLLFFRHWAGALEIDEIGNLSAGLHALWGGVFTVMSFLTTTGFESSAWGEARAWSGLATPGMILMGLALTGGGVATTAGGLKLLRVYSLYKHGIREMDRLVHPSSVGGAGSVARRLRRQGAYVAWVFFMLFALSLAFVAIALSLTGLGFETSATLAVATLSTTGPLAISAPETPIIYGSLGDGAKMIIAAAMVLGRIEALAIIALLNPDFWRS